MRPGTDTTLKMRLAGISGEAARVLARGMHVECADVRVRNALAAALGDPAITAAHRRELAVLALTVQPSEGDDTDDEVRDETLRFRVSADESQTIRERSDAAGVTLSEYVRQLALGR